MDYGTPGIFEKERRKRGRELIDLELSFFSKEEGTSQQRHQGKKGVKKQESETVDLETGVRGGR